MFTGKIRLILIMLLSLVTVSTLVTTAACTPAETEMLRGVLENVDSVNGKVTIVTEDGKTVTVKITTETEVEADGASASLETLEPGASVDVEVKKDDRVARHIKARQAEAVGWGIIEIRVTDPPPADVKSANVTLTNIEVHKVSGNVSEWIMISDNISSFNLMDVCEVAAVLASANLTAGSFTQIRMDVVKVVGETTDNVSYTAEVPSGKLRIVRPFNVGGGGVTVLVLDFDGEKSLIRTGEGRYLFKPVVKLKIEYPEE